MSKIFWEIIVALTLIFSPAARGFVRSAATTCWNVAKGVVAVIWPPTRAIFRWTIRLGIVAIVLIVAGIWFPSLHILAAIVLAAWFFLWMEALSLIASAVGGISITIPGTSTTLSGAPIAAALRSAGKPLGLFLMFLASWIFQIVVFPGLMAFAGLIIFAAIFFWAGYSSVTGAGFGWLVKILVIFFWLSILGFVCQGVARYTSIGDAMEENRKENFRAIELWWRRGTVERHLANRAEDAQIEYDRNLTYPYRDFLWSTDEKNRGMDSPIYYPDGTVVAITDRAKILKILHSTGSWHPTEEEVPKKILSEKTGPLRVVEAPNNRKLKFIISPKCLEGYMDNSTKSSLESAQLQKQRAIEKKKILNELIEAQMLSSLNWIKVVKRTNIEPFWRMDQGGYFTKESIATDTIANVLGRSESYVPEYATDIPVEALPAGVPEKSALKIEILQGANIGATGWLPAEFAEWIENPLLPANPGGGGLGGGQTGARPAGQKTFTVTTPDGKEIKVTRGVWADTGYLVDLGKDEESPNFILSGKGLVSTALGGSAVGVKPKLIDAGGTFTGINRGPRQSGAVWVKVE